LRVPELEHGSRPAEKPYGTAPRRATDNRARARSTALAQGGGTTKVKTKVTLKYQQSGTPPYNEGSRFYGKVKGTKAPGKAKKACKKGRKVKVKDVGKTKTNKKGEYEIVLNGPAAPGTYQAKVKKKTIHKNGEKIVCKKGKSKLTVS
jgi:hypothetical protein